MIFRVLRALRHLPYRPLTAAAVLVALAWLAGHAERLATLTTQARLAAVVLTVVLLGHWTLTWLAPALSTGRWVDRRDDASIHAGGVATWTDIGEKASRSAMRRRAVTLRPSLAAASRRRRRRTPVTEYAVPLLRTGWLPVGSTVWSSCEEVTLRIGGPRSGKSASMACHALDAPGSLLVTSSRTDLLNATRGVRARKGRVDVFNPTDLGGVESTVRWTPLAGCTDYGTAQRRAADLIPTSSSNEGERWDVQARGLLATLLHAAALSGGSMRTVLDWISPADAVARDEILTALGSTPRARSMATQIRSLYATNDRTLSSITATLLPHLKWVNDPTLAAAADANVADPDLLDVGRLVRSGTDTLYLVGRDDGAPTIIGALTAEVAHQVRMHAAYLGGRLDPPMTAILDEAPLTCGPIPLHDWTADMGGFNLTLHIAAQSLAQLRDVWGRERAAAILANTGALVVFGNIKSSDDLQEISTLCGSRLVALDADDNRPLPVMTPAEISTLPIGTALVLRNGLRPVIGHAPWIGERDPSRTAAAVRRLAATTRRRIVTWDGERQTRRAAAKAARAVLDGRGTVAPARPDGATTRPLDGRSGNTDGSHAGGGDT
ncbi:type IV secretory system conjugative DNA transfer family protein [Kineosporia sp. R_H_3]|uniref:type IV secretory system conjugative DNA transfer family protein n=1 Tax=Kineosporia sp. R_H_3 TaxID=1961848 RepID=UPI000B4B39DC|nr:type IV secretory system conjugative DNA transfer family protein [Kineosporia sp. R_H_3]